MKTWFIALSTAFLLVVLPTASFAASPRGPSGCPPEVDPSKWICFTIPEAAKIDSALASIDGLKLALAAEKAARPSRFGWTLGPGAGADFCNSPTGVCPSIGLYLTFSFRLSK